MKQNRLQRLLSMAIALMMALTMVVSSTAGAFAASGKYTVDLGNPSGMYVGAITNVWVWNQKTGKNAKIVSVKSSNPKVFKVGRFVYWDSNDNKHTGYRVKAKKAGKSKITVKYKVNGKTKTYKKTIKALPYPNHIKSLKVNGKKVNLKGDQRYWYYVKNKKTKAKIEMKLQDGWKISYASGNYYNDKTAKGIKGVKTLVKSGKNISFPKKWTGMNIYVEMSKGDNIISYSFSFWR